MNGKHVFETADAPELCNQCHSPVNGDADVHDPAEDGCLDCHDPHGSDTPALLTAPSESELCFECHDEESFEPAVPHDPVESGECTACHDPHSSPHDNLLVAVGRELCGDCHDEVVEVAETSKTGHAAALEGRQCLSCHAPHGSEQEALLVRPLVDLCLSCHDRPISVGERTLIDVDQWLEEHDDWHDPILKNGCSACHEPHGGEQLQLLRKSFPPGLYAHFATHSYALCFSCHDPNLARSRRTRSATGFRDGDRNLHRVHVDRGDRGRTCRVCHDAHAAGNPKLVRESVPYGMWKLPIGYEALLTGGSCHPGCHSAKTYDRDRSLPGRSRASP
ncbi:MAG: cytochrome c3 family protein [Myxococcota bacterium]